MARLPLPHTLLIHENLSIVMTFAFSYPPLEEWRRTQFLGRWRYLDKTLFELSEARAVRAVLELALLLRVLDDEEPMPANMRAGAPTGYGDLFAADGSKRHLNLREVTNKIIHAARLTWDFSREASPILVCDAREGETWTRAEIRLVDVAVACSNIMS